MPKSWHRHRAGLGREGDCDFSPWQKAADWMGSQASGRSMDTGRLTWAFPSAGAREQSQAPLPFCIELWICVT